MHGQYNDSLHDGKSGDQIPLGMRFPTPVKTSPEGQWLGCGIDHPPPSPSSLWAFKINYRVKFKLYLTITDTLYTSS